MEPIAGDAEQFKQSFREEAREILTELESALLELNENRSDPDLVSRVFRGLHTIKGSGAMFGFERMAAFTHDLETAFAMVRDGRLAIVSELIDLTLSALDQIRTMLEEETGGELANAAACAGILESVRRLAGIHQNAVAAEKCGETHHDPAVPGGPVRSWRIRFAPGPDLMRCGANPLLLLRELRTLGSVSIQASMTAVPSLAEIDPERCYVSWDMELATAASLESIRDVFIFVEDTCEISVEPGPDASARMEPAPQADITARALDEKRAASPGRRNHDKSDAPSSLRVPAAKLDQFVNLVGELVTVQARLSELARGLGNTEMSGVSEEIDRLTSALRESSISLRMIPIRGTFEKFRRLVHDLARELGKQVELTIEGADTELDKTVIEQLGDPLMHLIRNSMDHGIEPAAERAARGKPPTASIHLCARHSGTSVLVSVTDDGRGIDATAVRARALEKGLIGPHADLSETEIYALLFQPGFSTAKQVTDLSGRGVGMDVVRQKIELLRGSIDVASKPGEGTGVTMRLPLTMAIIDGLVLGVSDACFVLPMASTLGCIELTREDIALANGEHVANVRGEIVPYIRLREQFDIQSGSPEIEQVMLVETGDGTVGIVVDRVLGNCQTVIKSLGHVYRQVQFVSGATILGNGSVALILDPERLVQDAIRGVSHAPRGQPKARAERRNSSEAMHQSAVC